jgi:hypothetical protein
VNTLKRDTLSLLSIVVLLGLILSLTQLAAPAEAQTTNRDEIRATIQQLEKVENDLNQDIANYKELIPRLNSDDYVIVDTTWGLLMAVPRSDFERRLSIEVHLGKKTQQEAIKVMETLDTTRQQLQAVIRQELPRLEQQVTKTHDDISYYLNELARLNEAAPSSPTSRSGSSITAQDLTGGTWETNFNGHFTQGVAEIKIAGNELRVKNQFGQLATAHLEGVKIIVTSGWPDSTPDHPITGTVIRTDEGLKIEWGQLLQGHGNGGSWLKK